MDTGFFVLLAAVVVLIEAAIEAITMLFNKDTFDIKMVYAGVLGGACAWLFGLDALGYLGLVPVIEYPLVTLGLNIVVLGLFFVRHAGNLNDLLEFIKGLRPK
jgi:hypothetical protein